MRRSEISYKAEIKELEKLQARLERNKKALDKAEAKAEKFGVKDMSHEEHYEWLQNVETEGFFIKNKIDQDKNSAWFDLYRAQDAVKETETAIEKAEARLDKKLTAFEEDKKEQEKLQIVKRDNEGLTFEEEQKLWAEDGIKLEGRGYLYHGKTPQGKTFCIYKNSYGYTQRSLKCFTLKIDGEVIFTSGLFWRCYTIVKNS